MTLRVLDLFSGIGGFSLGLERTGGFKTVAFCEIEPFPRRVLAKHWPEVPCYDDVRTLTADRLRSDGIAVDVICGGFPCQDISLANNNGAGLAGAKSGLWSEYARLIGDVRPQFVIVENVSMLRSRGLGVVLGDLARLGYDAEWESIPAAAVGAPHIRDRLWLVAYPNGDHKSDLAEHAEARGRAEALVHSGGGRYRASQAPVFTGWDASQLSSWWSAEPAVGRVADGLPGVVDELAALGNAVVPQVPELIGNAILASLAEREAA
jgi:DNA (cytosine-5)-methyltransferase 1